MSLIQVTDLTFGYEGSFENIFEKVSLQLDTCWKLGFIGRNGRGKTTFLKLLLGEYEYRGTITASVGFDYFPFPVPSPHRTALEVVRETVAPFARWEEEMESCLAENTPQALLRYGDLLERYTAADGYTIDALIQAESGKLGVEPGCLDRPWVTLSGGEQVKLMLAALFLKKNRFLLIDEPTNHLDLEGRQAVADYLRGKEGFILVSHDRQFLDEVVDHVLTINRANIQVQRGNYSSWQRNKDQEDSRELAENQRLRQDIKRLEQAARRTAGWSDRVEATKKGSLNSGLKPDKGYIGHKAAKMMKRSKAIENRQEKAIEEKSALLRNIEQNAPLKLHILPHPKSRWAEARGLAVAYGDTPLFAPVDFTLSQGDRIALTGPNGSGKSSLLRLFLGEDIPHLGEFTMAGGLTVSHIAQTTDFLQGALQDYIRERQLDESLFKTILRKLDFSRSQFDRRLEDYSGGQKKKVLLAAALAGPAHLLLWDEPLNFIDLLSRSQIEELLLRECPTMVFVEHDRLFARRIATKTVELTPFCGGNR